MATTGPEGRQQNRAGDHDQAWVDAVNDGTTLDTFTIDDRHFPQDWLASYGSVDRKIGSGKIAGRIYVTGLAGDNNDINPDVPARGGIGGVVAGRIVNIDKDPIVCRTRTSRCSRRRKGTRRSCYRICATPGRILAQAADALDLGRSGAVLLVGSLLPCVTRTTRRAD